MSKIKAKEDGGIGVERRNDSLVRLEFRNVTANGKKWGL